MPAAYRGAMARALSDAFVKALRNDTHKHHTGTLEKSSGFNWVRILAAGPAKHGHWQPGVPSLVAPLSVSCAHVVSAMSSRHSIMRCR